MTILAVNAPDERITWDVDIADAVSRLPLGARVTLLTHGFRYSPYDADACPHARLFSATSRKTSWKSVSWAHYLRLNRADAGLTIGFGWPGLGRLDQAAHRAYRAGEALATLMDVIHAARPDLRLNVVAHSLGARVALRAMARSQTAAVDTVLLLSGADYRDAAMAALAAPAGQRARVINVTSGENRAFDLLFRVLAPSRAMFAPSLSAGLNGGLNGTHPRWLDLRIDAPGHLSVIRAMGYRPAAPTHAVCHWSSFIRPGLFPLYRDLLGDGGASLYARLAGALPQAAVPARPPRAGALPPGRTV